MTTDYAVVWDGTPRTSRQLFVAPETPRAVPPRLSTALRQQQHEARKAAAWSAWAVPRTLAEVADVCDFDAEDMKAVFASLRSRIVIVGVAPRERRVNARRVLLYQRGTR